MEPDGVVACTAVSCAEKVGAPAAPLGVVVFFRDAVGFGWPPPWGKEEEEAQRRLRPMDFCIPQDMLASTGWT